MLAEFSAESLFGMNGLSFGTACCKSIFAQSAKWFSSLKRTLRFYQEYQAKKSSRGVRKWKIKSEIELSDSSSLTVKGKISSTLLIFCIFHLEAFMVMTMI